MAFESLQAAGAIASIIGTVKDVGRLSHVGWRRVVRRLGKQPHSIMILVADLNGDQSERWKLEIVDTLRRRRKRQDFWHFTVDADYGSSESLTYKKGLNILSRFKYDVLISGRVRPTGQSAKVTVLGRNRGVVGEVVLTDANEQGGNVASIDELNTIIEIAMMLAVESDAHSEDGQRYTVDQSQVLTKRLEEIEKQLVEEIPLRVSQINSGYLLLGQGDSEQDTDKLEKARKIFLESYNQKWFPERDYDEEAAIGHSLVFQSRMSGDFELLKEGLSWYRRATESAEKREEYSKWAELGSCVIGTCLECYQRSGNAAWIEQADDAQDGFLELAARRLSADETREGQEVVCYARAVRAGYQGDTAEFTFAIENLRDFGRFDMMVELGNVATNAVLSGLVREVSSLDKQFEHWYHETKSARKRDNPREWALVNNRLAICYAEIAERDGDVSKFWRATKHFGRALEVWTEEESQSNYALAMDNLGTVYHKYYVLTGNLPALRNAVHAHRQSFKYRKPTANVREWASTARNAAPALCALATEERSREYVDQAIDLLRQVMDALTELNDSNMLYDVGLNLAVAYDARYQLGGLEEDRYLAIRMYSEALSEEHPVLGRSHTEQLRRRLAKLEEET